MPLPEGDRENLFLSKAEFLEKRKRYNEAEAKAKKVMSEAAAEDKQTRKTKKKK